MFWKELPKHPTPPIQLQLSTSWKIVVFVGGLVGALIITDYGSFSLQKLLSDMIIYAAASTIFYQTGKMGINLLFVKIDEK